jgi:BRCA1 C Terminus (BRCT) domain
VKYRPEEANPGLHANVSTRTNIGIQSSSTLDGCIIYISKELQTLASELENISKQLGAQVASVFDPANVTHLIHPGQCTKETSHEFERAQNAKIHIVDPQWLYHCQSKKLRCAEKPWDLTWKNSNDHPIVDPTTTTNSDPPNSRREKRARQDENSPPEKFDEPVDSAKLEHTITKLLGNISSPQRKSKRRLAGRAREAQKSMNTSSVNSSDGGGNSDSDIPRPTQDKVEYKDPVAEREMAKIIANLQGAPGHERTVEDLIMTPAEDSMRKMGRRKSTRKEVLF